MLKSKIYALLKADMKPRTVTEIATSINEDNIKVLRAITEMSKSRVLNIAFVKPLSSQLEQSTYYSVR